jgi:putative flippase GtrA
VVGFHHARVRVCQLLPDDDCGWTSELGGTPGAQSLDVREMVAAGIGGGLATVVDMSALVALVESGTPIALAAFLAAGCGAVVAFAWSKYVAFRDRSRLGFAQVARYATVAVATALLMALAMQLVAVEIGVPYVLAKIACSALVFALWSYPAQRRFVFALRFRSELSPSSSMELA